MTLELILQDIELAENIINENTFDIWVNEKTGTFIAKENTPSGRTFKYALKGKFEDIAKENRYDILQYRLGKVTPEDEVFLEDVFMQGQFIELIQD